MKPAAIARAPDSTLLPLAQRGGMRPETRVFRWRDGRLEARRTGSPDWADPCKHSAAACYLIADALDADPFALFLLRGRTRDQVLTEMRPPAFIYKILIRHVFAYLRKQGAEDRISALQSILYSLPEDTE